MFGKSKQNSQVLYFIGAWKFISLCMNIFGATFQSLSLGEKVHTSSVFTKISCSKVVSMHNLSEPEVFFKIKVGFLVISEAVNKLWKLNVASGHALDWRRWKKERNSESVKNGGAKFIILVFTWTRSTQEIPKDVAQLLYSLASWSNIIVSQHFPWEIKSHPNFPQNQIDSQHFY